MWLYKLFEKIMTQENKELLLKDLSSRLPYQPLCKKVDAEDDFCEFDAPLGYSLRDLVDNKIIIKPYLRPMSSIASLITAKEWSSLSGAELIDWYNANHIDYRDLIPMELAIEVTKENNPYK